MKKSKLTLEKFKVTNLNNPIKIFGGNGTDNQTTGNETQTDTVIGDKPTRTVTQPDS